MNWSKGTKIYWLCFAIAQIAGFISPLLGNVHSNLLPIFLGVFLLLPADLLGLLADRWDPTPGWIAQIAFGALVVLINAAVWYVARKLLRSPNANEF